MLRSFHTASGVKESLETGNNNFALGRVNVKVSKCCLLTLLSMIFSLMHAKG